MEQVERLLEDASKLIEEKEDLRLKIGELTEELRREKQLFEMECATHRFDLGLLQEARQAILDEGMAANKYREALDLMLSPEPKSFLRARFGATMAAVEKLLA